MKCKECNHPLRVGFYNTNLNICTSCEDKMWEDYKELTNDHAFHKGVDCYGNEGLFEDFEQSIGE